MGGNSYCQRRQVGALIVKDKMIISDGYNGTPSGLRMYVKMKTISPNPMCSMPKPMPLPNSTLQQQQQRCHNVRHGLSLYRMCQTHHPGRNQACRILRKYRLEDGIELLKRAGIEVIYMSIES